MKIILGTQSPRRKALLSQMDINFSSVNIDCEENFDTIEAKDVATYLAQKKSQAYGDLKSDELLITADTTVLINDTILNKPNTKQEAIDMLLTLSGSKHQVNTAVCLRSIEKKHIISEFSSVWFCELSRDEIIYYVENYEPYDKAGSYGIQEWIGLCKIEKIEGCYYNIMGLPTARLFDSLKKEFRV